jgi:7-cyano-7-deazaguanine synthase in queuosine biosynthesis
LGQARFQQAERVVWPAAYNGVVKAMARGTEQVVLCEHLADLEGGPMPRIETPLLELADQQLIELGGQLGVPWDLAWSCLGDGDRMCRVCPACRRRKAAFDAAGVVDAAEKVVVGMN